MEGRTQLIIDGVEVVLPERFSTTVKRENSFFTKNGEYTYDCTLRLDNQTNQSLYGWLHRLNKKEAVRSKRSAVLMADGRVYCRGTEVITGWTEDEVTVQVVAGNSELNYFIGNDLKIEWQDLGEITSIEGYTPASVYPDFDFCFPTLRTPEGNTYNTYSGSALNAGERVDDALRGMNLRPQPYLCAIVRRLIAALGYSVGVNQLEDTMFKYMFLVNTIRTVEYAKMIPGWTVKDFLTEVESLCGVVFVTDNLRRTVDIVQKSVYYANARQLPIEHVVDEYELTVEDEGEGEFTTADVAYDIPSHFWEKLVRLPEGAFEASKKEYYDSFAELVTATGVAGKILCDRSTGRRYMQVTRTYTPSTHSGGSFGGSGTGTGTTTEEATSTFLIEIDQFRDLKRENSSADLSLKFTPAPFANLGAHGCEVIDIGTTNGYRTRGSDATQTGQTADEGEESSLEDLIRGFEKAESSAIDIYCAFHNGYRLQAGPPVAYNDAYHAQVQMVLSPMFAVNTFVGQPVGSLRLPDIDAELYAGVYRVDTTRRVTFTTFDPNVIDPRSILVVRNRRWVVRDIEETLTSKGRKPSWKVTCHPIEITDTAAESRWVLTKGVWDDGGAWIDSGKWND